jgi:hypothetical protein
LYSSLRLFVNFFQPSFKLAGKIRDGAKVKKMRIPMMPPGHTEVKASTCSNLMPSTVLR